MASFHIAYRVGGQTLSGSLSDPDVQTVRYSIFLIRLCTKLGENWVKFEKSITKLNQNETNTYLFLQVLRHCEGCKAEQRVDPQGLCGIYQETEKWSAQKAASGRESSYHGVPKPKTSAQTSGNIYR